jgi:tetratricopeptide (TPR) repeat protein
MPRPDTTEVELEAFDDDPVVEPPAPELSIDAEMHAVISTCENEIAAGPDPLRASKLHYEIAAAYETSGFLDKAAEHYKQALGGAPEYLPAIRGARRTQIARGEFEAALGLFDDEVKLTTSTVKKALLLHTKGRLIEDRLDDAVRAREVYSRALDLDPSNASVLKAIEQCDRRANDVEALLGTLERTANVISEDARHRAAVLVERAHLIERHNVRGGAAASEIYEAALDLDHHALGALDALQRIYRRERDWRGLSTALEKEARQREDAAHRALALYRLAQIQEERLNNRAESIAALVKASAATPSDPLVLEDLARGYEQTGEHQRLVEVLVMLIEVCVDQRERVTLLHRLAQVLEGPLEHPDAAIERYREALSIDPTALPVIEALGRLLASRAQWPMLVEMHLAEANATDVPLRAAAAHARVAEVLELHLRDPAEAAAHHARALSFVPGYPASFKALTRLLAQLDRPRELVELLERAVEQATHSSLRIAYLMKIGSIWEDSLGDPVQALHAYRRVLDLDRANLVAIHAVQRVAERAERYPALVEALEREVELVDDTAHRVGLLNRVATVFDDQLKDQDGALVRFRKVLEIDPKYVPALIGVGRIYFRAGRWADLHEIYERRLSATSGNERVSLLYELGELCETKLGESDKAIAWYQNAVEEDATFRPAIRALTRRLREKKDWKALVRAYELEAAALEDPKARAITWYRIGQVHEDWLDDATAATKAYQTALELRPGYRPARAAIARQFSEQRRWMPLIETLTQEASATDDPIHSTTALLRQAEIYRDEVNDAALAILCYEAVAENDIGAIPALLALAPMYAASGAWDKLAMTNAQLANKLGDPAARIAALRELARLQDGKVRVSPRRRTETFEVILALQSDDEPALVALEQIGRATRDDRILARVYSRLGEIAESPAMGATFYTELGRALERLGDRHALDAFRAAVKKDTGMLTSIRGLARVADLRGDARAMAQAARLEAELTRKPEIAAKLFVRAGILRREQMNDLGAVEDFERALDVWPDEVQGAERIIQPLLETGQVVRLIDILSKTATSAKSSERKTALWLEVGNLYARKFDNLGAAITAFKRSLDATPGHVVALSRLAEAYERNRQWGDAVATLEQLLTLTSDEATRAEAHLKLAGIFDDHLKKIDRASRCVEAVLRHDPKHAGALQRLADIQLRSGNEAAAVETTQRLVDLADTPKEKGAAFVRVARIQRKRGETAAADAALSEALALEGPNGDAERELKQHIETGGSWVGYSAGLASYIKRVGDTRDPGTRAELATAYLELAHAYADGMNLPNKAIEALEQGVRTLDDERLVLQLVQRLRLSGRLDDALAALHPATMRDMFQPDSWRELGVVLDQAGRRDEAQRVASALELFGVEHALRVNPPRPVSAAENSFDANALQSLALEGAVASPQSMLLASISDVIGKLFPPSLERYGIAARDRLSQRSANSSWELAMRIGRIFGVAELEIYEHDGADPAVAVELFEIPALLVSSRMRRMPIAQQAFLLAYAIGPIAQRLHPALSLRTGDLEIALVAAARVFTPSVTLRGSVTSEIEEAKEIMRKAINRKWRRSAEVAAGELAGKPPLDLARWHSALLQTAIRAALIVADDLAASIDALPSIIDLPAIKGAALVQSSEPVRDLVRFWISNRATTLRRNAGMI